MLCENAYTPNIFNSTEPFGKLNCGYITITALNTCRLIDHTHLFKHFSYLFFLIHAFGTKKCVLQQQGNFSNSSTETRSGTKLTFQHRLLLLFVILPDHMTIPRKSWFPVLQAFVVYFAPITWFKKKKKKNFGPRVPTCLFHYQRKAGSP